MVVIGPIKIRRIQPNDRPWIQNFWLEHWGGDFMVTKGKKHHLNQLEGLIAEVDGDRRGLLVYETVLSELDIITHDSLLKNKGVGSALVSGVVDLAKAETLKRVWLMTSNDNLNALKFWQKRGFRLFKVYP